MKCWAETVVTQPSKLINVGRAGHVYLSTLWSRPRALEARGREPVNEIILETISVYRIFISALIEIHAKYSYISSYIYSYI